MRALTLTFGVFVLGSPFVAAQSHTPEVPAHAAEAKSPAPHGPLTTPPSRPTSAQTPTAEKAAVVKPSIPVPADIEAKLQALRERVAAARAAAPRTRARAGAAPRPVPRPRVVVRWPEDRVTLTWSHPDERVLVSWAR